MTTVNEGDTRFSVWAAIRNVVLTLARFDHYTNTHNILTVLNIGSSDFPLRAEVDSDKLSLQNIH